MLETDTLGITPEILSFIARTDEFKGAWRALGTLAHDRLSALCSLPATSAMIITLVVNNASRYYPA